MLIGCTGASKQVEFYDLKIEKSSTKSIGDVNVVSVGPDRQRMHFHHDVFVEVLEFSRWIEEPGRLLENKMKLYFKGDQQDPRVDIELLDFSYDAGQQTCRLAMLVKIKGGDVLRFDLNKSDVEEDPEQVARAMSGLVEQVFEGIAKNL